MMNDMIVNWAPPALMLAILALACMAGVLCGHHALTAVGEGETAATAPEEAASNVFDPSPQVAAPVAAGHNRIVPVPATPPGRPVGRSWKDGIVDPKGPVVPTDILESYRRVNVTPFATPIDRDTGK